MGIIKKIIEWKLGLLARMVLKRYRPVIVGVTGSVGKTSTKEAIYAVLSSVRRVRRNRKSYNNEFGVPLTIIGRESGFRNPFAWLGIFFTALALLIWKRRDYPEVLVLEMGADKPGDIGRLTRVAPCTVGVVTAVSPVHLEFYRSMDRLIAEKRKLVSHLPPEGMAVLCADDAEVLAMREKVSSHVLTYGFTESADVRATEPSVSQGQPDPQQRQTAYGISFKMTYRGSTVPVFLPSVLGKHQVLAGLAAAAVSISQKMNLHEIVVALRNFASPPGRMSLIPGIKYTNLIDDSYNSSPRAAVAALDTLAELSVPGRKIAALGDMAELGSETEPAHRQVGEHAAKVRVDILVTVGKKAETIAKAALAAGLPAERVRTFERSGEAGRFIQHELKQGDVVLIKGSQIVRMERITKELMAEPLRAGELLVRQGPEW